MNAFGIDVSGLDAESFVQTASALFPVLALGWLLVVHRLRRPGWLLAGVVLANAWVWAVTNFPLRQLYALSSGHDRLLQLGLVQVVAAGHTPLHTSQVGHLHFEPFWGLLVAALGGWSIDCVLALYPFLSLATAVGFALSLHHGLRPPPGSPQLSPWARALAAGFATLLSSAPLEHLGTYRVPWALTFLLKPNHALGLVLLPWLVWSFVRVRSWTHRIATGALLHLMGWVFVLHMAYVSVSLVVFAVLSVVERREEARRDVLDVGAVLAVNLAVVSPYLVMLLVGYPFLVPSANMTIPVWSPHLLEATLRHCPIFLLGMWGAWTARRRGDRLGRLLFALVAGALLVWAAYPLLGAVGLAREKDEIYYWVRFVTGAAAGLGAWELGARVAAALGRPSLDPAARAVLIALLVLPSALPSWWDPLRMDAYFPDSLEPISTELAGMGAAISRESRPSDVCAGDPQLLRWVAALTGRRGLYLGMHVPADHPSRMDFTDRLLAGDDGEALLRDAARWNVRLAVVNRATLERYPGLSIERLAARDHMKLIFEHRTPRDYLAVFRLQGGSE